MAMHLLVMAMQNLIEINIFMSLGYYSLNLKVPFSDIDNRQSYNIYISKGYYPHPNFIYFSP